ncbi:hypothetical protein JCM33374_g1002 [Metschnikowia sp. JCM 33374]|nr:hypothetical protein JCM33374_g1002 [Metschnikowia sp. JCM 33374]
MRTPFLLIATTMVSSLTVFAATSYHRNKCGPLHLLLKPSLRGLGEVLDKKDILESFLTHEGGSHNESQCPPKKSSNTIESFVKHLKSFVGDTRFDSERFDAQSGILRQQLYTIIHEMNQKSNSKEDTDKVKFASNMLHILQGATERLSLYSHSGVDHILIRNVIGLNVRLLCFYNHNGIPDSEIEGYARSVTYFARTLKFWGELFEDLEDVPLDVWQTFKYQFEMAEGILHMLKSHKPNTETFQVGS